MIHQQELIRCLQCGKSISLCSDVNGCACGATSYLQRNGIYARKGLSEENLTEMKARDSQAKGYLQHIKFSTQVASFERWLSHAPKSAGAGLARPDLQVLELGCGPGPYSKLMKSRGYSVAAIDFSFESLRINAESCETVKSGAAIFVQEDLNKLGLQPESVDLLVMADFLQHLGSRALRERLLYEACNALRPGGRFYLSFFNLNIKNFLKGDIHGNFAGKEMAYERLSSANVQSSLPEFVEVEKIEPMNIFHSAKLDSMMRAVPWALLLARMAVITGNRK